jgi:hypothetical protein
VTTLRGGSLGYAEIVAVKVETLFRKFTRTQIFVSVEFVVLPKNQKLIL